MEISPAIRLSTDRDVAREVLGQHERPLLGKLEARAMRINPDFGSM